MKHNKAEKALLGIGHLLVGRIASRAITFIFLIAFVRLLDTEELAILPLYYAISGASVLLFSFGIPATLMREIPRLRMSDPAKMRSLLFTGFSFVFTGIIISSILAYVFSSPIKLVFFEQLEESTTFNLIIAGMIIGGWQFLMSFILKALQEYKELAVYSAVYDLLQRIFGLVGYLYIGIDGLIIGFLLGGLVSNSWYTKKFSNYIFSVRKGVPLSEIFRISWPFYIEGYLHYFRNYGDTLIISYVLGPAALAVFFVAKRMYDLLMMITRSIEDVVAPSLSQLLGKDINAASRGYSRINTLAPVALIPMGLMAAGLSYAFVDLVGGEKYAGQAFVTAAIFCIVALIEGLFGIQARAVFVLGKPINRLSLIVLQVGIYFPFLYFLIKQLGIIGAPISQGLSFIPALLVARVIIVRIIGIGQRNIITWKILFASLSGLCVLVFLQYYYYSVMMLPLYLSLAIVVIALIFNSLVTGKELGIISEALPLRLRGILNNYYLRRRKVGSAESSKK